MEKEIENKTNKINKLCNEYTNKILQAKGNLNMLLIDFTREYNEIWKE